MKKNPPVLELTESEAQECGAVKGALMFLGAVFKVERGDKEPAFETRYTMDHWVCSISTPMGRCKLDYWAGVALGGLPPNLMAVADCYARDARSAFNETLESFAGECGYELNDKEQKRDAQRAYKGCRKSLEQLTRILGPLWEPALMDDLAGLASAAFELSQDQPRFAGLEPSRGNAFGLLELAAFCAAPEPLAAALSADPSLDQLQSALRWLRDGPESEWTAAEECEGALESFIARKEIMEHVPEARARSAPKGI